ncbi:STAS domain-containing protein [Nocardia sp. NPDC004068]|uniref:STAS domain-containing protein n=1 Tax=Nocardia sp. NPDC004068 TaxID=3364303 RepID=UPI0036A62A6B
MTRPTLTITHDVRRSDIQVLTVSGELDHFTSPQLTAVLDDLPFTPGGGVILDLSPLLYCDSTGISVFLTAHQRAESANCPLLLAAATPDLRHLFEVVGLDRILNFTPTVDEALTHLTPESDSHAC